MALMLRENKNRLGNQRLNEVVEVIQLVMYHGSRLKEQSRQTRTTNESQRSAE